ncbi:MAG: hypothetical protein ILA06_08030 [Bacteroidaceae bacterium]|nr:hypothetical protein [Bacteroidaceae bacterium]
MKLQPFTTAPLALHDRSFSPSRPLLQPFTTASSALHDRFFSPARPLVGLPGEGC